MTLPEPMHRVSLATAGRRFILGALLLALAAASPAAGQAVDQYGGYTDKPGVGTGHFRLEKRGLRDVLVTPEGNTFWMRAVYGVDTYDGGTLYDEALKLKYGNDIWPPFAEDAVARLRSWGFNALGEYASNYVWPIESYQRGWSNPQKMPFIRIISPAGYSHGDPWRVKDIQYGVRRDLTTGMWRAYGFPDVFDPAFESAARHLARAADQFPDPAALSTPWLIGTTTDDRDYLFGFGRAAQHLGWVAMATAPLQYRNDGVWNTTYSDPVVHTKLAVRDFLRARYGSVDALNARWGSDYTSWESTPDHRGVLDEDGSRNWMGTDFVLMTDANSWVKYDLDAFVEVLADRYFSVVTTAIREVSPGKLVFSPAALSTGTPRSILRSAGRYCDVIQIESQRDSDLALALAFAYTAKPLLIYTMVSAQADAGFEPAHAWNGLDFPTQEERGAAYERFVQRSLNIRLLFPEDVYPVVGIDWWAYLDKVVGGEANNFGLVNVQDQGYDGIEALPYGDFLSAVRRANKAVHDSLR
jgi:agarase